MAEPESCAYTQLLCTVSRDLTCKHTHTHKYEAYRRVLKRMVPASDTSPVVQITCGMTRAHTEPKASEEHAEIT